MRSIAMAPQTLNHLKCQPQAELYLPRRVALAQNDICPNVAEVMLVVGPEKTTWLMALNNSARKMR